MLNFTSIKLVSISLLLAVAFSCKKQEDVKNPLIEVEPEQNDVLYTFFVAGHTYGNPMNFQYGFHPPFKNSIHMINSYPQLEFGVFTGDLVPKPTVDYWDSVEVDISKFRVETHISPGNHDKGDVFHSRYQDYYSFIENGDLFLILSPANWNIAGDQLSFLEGEIKTKMNDVNNIFIFCHELIWWSPENEFSYVEPNYRPHYPGSTNYWEDVQPLLDSVSNDVYIIAGDVGSSVVVSPWMYQKQDNITYLASGMGGGADDNMVFVEVDKSGNVAIKLIGVVNHKFGIIKEF